MLAVFFFSFLLFPHFTQANNSNFQVSAWLPVSWDQQSGLNSFEKNITLIDEINPFLFYIDEQAQLQNFVPYLSSKLVQLAQENSVEIVPTITNQFKKERVYYLLDNQEVADQLIADIIAKMERNGFQKIELDLEGMGVLYREKFNRFIENLVNQLHQKNLELVLVVQAKKSDLDMWDGPGGLDYQFLGEKVDYFKIMTYDFHNKVSTAGSLSPYSWLEEVLQYCQTKQIDSQKIYLGFPLYGYDWSTDNQVVYSRLSSKIEKIKEKYQVEEIFDPVTKSAYLQYFSDIDLQNRTLWFENQQSLKTKLQLVKDYNLAGISFWRLGLEYDYYWQVIKEYKQVNNILFEYQGSWFYDGLNLLLNKQILTEGDISPAKLITRQQAVQYLMQFFDFPLTDDVLADNVFIDTDKNQYLVSANTQGFLSSKELFYPQKTISRVEFTKLLLAMLTKKLEQAVPVLDLNQKNYLSKTFYDVNSGQRYAPYVYLALQENLLNSANVEFRLHYPLNQAELAKILMLVDGKF